MVLVYGKRYCFGFWNCSCFRLDDGFGASSMEMKTPEEMAEVWVSKYTTGSETYEHGLRNGILAGYQAATETYDARIKELEQAIIQSVDTMAGVKYDDENT